MNAEITLGLRRLGRAARRAELRLRFNVALRRLALLLPVPLTYAAAALTFVKLAQPEPAVVRLLFAGLLPCVLVPLVGVLSASFGARPRAWGALTLDRHYGTADRITNALTFSTLPEQTPLMRAAVADAVRRIHDPSARRAVPLRLPRDLGISVLLAAAVVLLSQLELRRVQAPPLAQAPAPQAILVGSDDIELLKEELDPLARGTTDPELAEAVRQFNQLLEDIAERKLDRPEAFQRTAALEQALFQRADADARELDEALRGLAEALKQSRLTAPVADALDKQELPDAEAALKKLAERLRQKAPTPAELERLRQALASASKSSSERVARLEQRRRELEEQQQRRLLKKKGDKDAADPDQAQAEQHQRRLEQLDRDIAGAKRGQEAMSQLDKDLAKAAEELMRELGQSAEHLEQGARDMNRLAQKKLTDAQKQALKERLEQLKELMRQGGAGREEHQRRLRNFGRRARGDSGQDEQAGQQGQGQPGSEGELRLGRGGGREIPIPMPGAAGASRAAQGREPGSGGQGKDKEWGAGTNDALRGKATELEGNVQDVAAAAVDTGQGHASSEVVYGAAERGFVGRGYKDVYTQYRTVMEDSLSKDEIPAGYESYVRRYFQLIRPRESR